jgi:hypothetical protein
MEQTKERKQAMWDKFWIGYLVIVLLIFAIGTFYALIPMYRHFKYGNLVIKSDAGCYIVGESGQRSEGRMTYSLPNGIYTIKSDRQPEKAWTLIATGHSFDADMPGGTCASVLDPRLARTFSCKNCAEAYWSTDAPE